MDIRTNGFFHIFLDLFLLSAHAVGIFQFKICFRFDNSVESGRVNKESFAQAEYNKVTIACITRDEVY